MRVCLTLALVLAFPAASSAATRCYSEVDNPGATITDDTQDNQTLVLKFADKTIEMRTKSGSTGLDVRAAAENDGTTHLYR
jgi:hypothetical protein